MTDDQGNTDDYEKERPAFAGRGNVIPIYAQEIEADSEDDNSAYNTATIAAFCRIAHTACTFTKE